MTTVYETNRFFDLLPAELQAMIYTADPTYSDIFSEVLSELKCTMATKIHCKASDRFDFEPGFSEIANNMYHDAAERMYVASNISLVDLANLLNHDSIRRYVIIEAIILNMDDSSDLLLEIRMEDAIYMWTNPGRRLDEDVPMAIPHFIIIDDEYDDGEESDSDFSSTSSSDYETE